MKKLEVSKILLLVSIPMWVACGNVANKSAISTTKSGNEISFVATPTQGLVRLKDGEDLNSVSNDVASDEGVRGFAEQEKVAAKEEIDAGKRAVNSVEPSAAEIDEGVRGKAAQVEIDEGVRGYTEEELKAMDEGVRGFVELDEGVRGLMEKIAMLDEGVRGKSFEMSGESFERLIKLDEGVRGLMATLSEIDEGVRGKKISLSDEGVRGKMAELQKQAEEYSNVFEKEFAETYKKFAPQVELDEGVRGKFALEKNILILEGNVSEEQFKESQVFYLVVNGSEKYEIKINGDTLSYGAKFELSDEDMKKMVLEFVFGKNVMTLLVQDGELQVYNK